jgi:hypothetical protein
MIETRLGTLAPLWNGIKPLAVVLVNMEAKAEGLGTAGDLVKAWIK